MACSLLSAIAEPLRKLFLSASEIRFYLADGVRSNFTLPAIFHDVYHGNFPGESVDDLWIAINRPLPFICRRFLSFVLPL